jgi:hypothetical protein
VHLAGRVQNRNTARELAERGAQLVLVEEWPCDVERIAGPGNGAGAHAREIDIHGDSFELLFGNGRCFGSSHVSEKIHARHELHGEKPLAGMLDQFAQAHEVRMHESLQCAKLLLEAQQSSRFLPAQQLERDAVAVLAIDGLVHHARAAASELADDAEPIGRHERRAHCHGCRQLASIVEYIAALRLNESMNVAAGAKRTPAYMDEVLFRDAGVTFRHAFRRVRSLALPMKERLFSLAAIVGLLFCGCGDSTSSGSADAATICGQKPAPNDGGACSPELPTCWTPTWRPPKPLAHACTEAQILEDFQKCHGDTFNSDCDVFERDPANRACLGCLLSTFDEPSYGAIVILSNGSFLSNVAGCIALLDGDDSATGCGAKYQALQECSDAACASQCADYQAYAQCYDAAETSLCTPEREGAVCGRRPSYDICTSYDMFEDYFVGMGKIFCVSGFDNATGDP